LALAVPLSWALSWFGGSSAFFVRPMSTSRRHLIVVGLMISVVIVCGFPVALFIRSQLPTKINYRLTLNIESDGVVYTGSGVIETVWYPGLKVGNSWFGNAWNAHVRGEAVVVDLGDHGMLFALLTDPATPEAGGRHGELFYPHNPERIPLLAFDAEKISGVLTQDFLNAISKRRDSVDLPLNKLPMLVRFTNLSDPRSVERVNPNDLPASFGTGVWIVSATLAVTDDPVTTGIEKKLVWLQTANDGSQDKEVRLVNEFRLNDKLSFRRGLIGGLATEDFKQP
jgi:hypothetical protein